MILCPVSRIEARVSTVSGVIGVIVPGLAEIGAVIQWSKREAPTPAGAAQ